MTAQQVSLNRRFGVPVDRLSTVQCPKAHYPDVMSFLCTRFSHVSPERWRQRFAAGEVVDSEQCPLKPEHPYAELVGKAVHYLRSLEFEDQIPFYAQEIFQDERLLVLDKPHFLPVIPAGRHFGETLLIRARRDYQNPDLTPAHRIDQDTAGLVLLLKTIEHRGTYQRLFFHHQIAKTYQAIAGFRPELSFPRTHRSRLVNGSHFMQMQEVLGEANSETHMEVLETQAESARARYQLKPKSGKRHQLRAHLSGLGIAIENDRIYPRMGEKGAPIDYSKPMKLLAQSLYFMDPIDGQVREFHSKLQLSF